jgi:hypothetical protein
MKIGDQDFPNLHTRRLAGGRLGWYWVPPPKARTAFTSAPLGDELNAAALERYAKREQALARWRKERARAVQQDGTIPGTVDWLTEEYYRTTHFTGNDPKTQTDYRNKLNFLRNYRLDNGERIGSLPWAELRAKHADIVYQRICWRDDGTPRMPYGRSVILQARIVWNWAEEYQDEEFQRNPWKAPKMEVPKSRTVKWEPGQVWRFIKKAEDMDRLSVGLSAVFCYELGQRVGDARRLTRAAFEGSKIRIVQNKTDRELLLPVSEILASWVAKIPAEQPQLVINERTGRQYEDYELSKAAAEVREAAELPSHLTLMDLRRTCISELGNLEASDEELISVGGWSDRQMINVYSLKEYKRALGIMQRRWAERDAA